MNKYYCSDGSAVSQATIDKRRSDAYKEYYLFEPLGSCEGCGGKATCTAHIIPQSRLKILRLTNLIWNPVVWFRSCYDCNTIAENVSSDAIKNLLNYNRISEIIRKYDEERYRKLDT